MAVSLVGSPVVATLSNQTTATLAMPSTPTTGDVIVVVVDLANAATISSVSGMGATWAQQYFTQDIGGAAQNNATHAIWFGTGASASGNVTVTISTGRSGTVRGFHVRGLTSTTITASTVTYANSATPSLPGNAWTTNAVGPSQTATDGQFVLNFWYTNDTATTNVYPATSAPAAGWTTQTRLRDTIWGCFNSSYRIPTASDAHQLTATTATTKAHFITQAVIGDAAGGGGTVTGSVAATAPPASSAIAGTVVTTGSVAGTAPAATASVAGAVTATGSVAATAPSAAAEIIGAGIITGDLAATAPAASSSIAGSVPILGTVTGAAPAASAAIVGDVTGAPAGLIPLDVAVDLLILSQESQEPIVETDGMVLLDATVDILVRHQLTPAAPPLGVLYEWPIRRQAHLMPALSASSPRYRPGDYVIDRANVGRPHVFVDGVDVTYLRDSPIRFRDITESVQVGPVSASLTVPQMRPWDEPGVGDLAMLDGNNDPRVEVVMFREDGTREYWFEGALSTDEDSSGSGSEEYTFQAEGALLQAAHENYDPPLFMRPTDPGWVVADVLNSVTHRRYGKIPRFTTGLPKITDTGSQGQSKWQRAQDVLSKCIDDNGRQLALHKVGPWEFRLGWKQEVATPQWTVTKGAPGVEVSLRVGQSTRRDCIIGRGVAPDGGVWGNWFFPGLDFYRPPRYPMNNSAINLDGLSDAQTDTGNGITLWQRRMRDLGFRVRVDGVMNSADVKWVRQIQRARGITVDGSLGPQTWSATFDNGYAKPKFDVVRRPLATVNDVDPWLYSASGAKVAKNPNDNPKKIRHAMPEVDFGTNIWKRDAIRLAQKMLERDAVPAHVGTITLTTDPHEPNSSRFSIAPGDNVKVVGHRGDVVVQVAEVSKDDLTVTLTVDSKARDMLALDAILERDRDARRDISSRTARTTDMSSLNKSEVVQFESESKAGFYPRTAINGGLWTVLPMFVSQVGVAKVDFRAQSPKAEMVVALFEKPIAANKLASYLSNPLASSEGWYDNVEVLEAKHGLLEIFGSDSSPGGYWPRQKGKGPLTGRMRDSSGALYSSKYGGIVWVAVFTSRSTWVDGRVFPASGR